MFYFHFAFSLIFFAKKHTVLITVYTRKLVRLLGPCFKTGQSKENQENKMVSHYFHLESIGIELKM